MSTTNISLNEISNLSPDEINQLLFEYSIIPKTAFIDERPKSNIRQDQGYDIYEGFFL